MTAALEGDDLEEIKAATEELTEIVQQLSVKLYEQAAQASKALKAQMLAHGEAPKGRDNVVDADYEVVDEQKNKT